MYPLPRLQRLYQVRSLRMLDTAKNRGVTLLYWIPGGGPRLARKEAGESLSGLGTDCTVKSARWSLVWKRRPNPPSGAPASSLKIVTGTSTLALVLGITYLRHSVAPAVAIVGRRLRTRARSTAGAGMQRYPSWRKNKSNGSTSFQRPPLSSSYDLKVRLGLC